MSWDDKEDEDARDDEDWIEFIRPKMAELVERGVIDSWDEYTLSRSEESEAVLYTVKMTPAAVLLIGDWTAEAYARHAVDGLLREISPTQNDEHEGEQS